MADKNTETLKKDEIDIKNGNHGDLDAEKRKGIGSDRISMVTAILPFQPQQIVIRGPIVKRNQPSKPLDLSTMTKENDSVKEVPSPISIPFAQVMKVRPAPEDNIQIKPLDLSRKRKGENESKDHTALKRLPENNYSSVIDLSINPRETNSQNERSDMGSGGNSQIDFSADEPSVDAGQRFGTDSTIVQRSVTMNGFRSTEQFDETGRFRGPGWLADYHRRTISEFHSNHRHPRSIQNEYRSYRNLMDVGSHRCEMDVGSNRSDGGNLAAVGLNRIIGSSVSANQVGESQIGRNLSGRNQLAATPLGPKPFTIHMNPISTEIPTVGSARTISTVSAAENLQSTIIQDGEIQEQNNSSAENSYARFLSSLTDADPFIIPPQERRAIPTAIRRQVGTNLITPDNARRNDVSPDERLYNDLVARLNFPVVLEHLYWHAVNGDDAGMIDHLCDSLRIEDSIDIDNLLLNLRRLQYIIRQAPQ